ncbi:hypothetical protein OIU78_013062 [Salix suchowensis]|nr:hypothetical protein OIU78_013062 [Salix suchowensis]
MARYYNHHSYLDYISYFSMPLHLFFFIFILFSILCLSWYINYESKLEDLISQVKLFLMLSPLVLLLAVRCLSSNLPSFYAISREGLASSSGRVSMGCCSLARPPSFHDLSPIFFSRTLVPIVFEVKLNILQHIHEEAGGAV